MHKIGKTNLFVPIQKIDAMKQTRQYITFYSNEERKIKQQVSIKNYIILIYFIFNLRKHIMSCIDTYSYILKVLLSLVKKGFEA